MGDVKNAIHGSAPSPSPKSKTGAPTSDGLIGIIADARTQVSDMITKKEHDVAAEGPDVAPENRRKVALLRAVYRLLTAVHSLLVDY